MDGLHAHTSNNVYSYLNALPKNPSIYPLIAVNFFFRGTSSSANTRDDVCATHTFRENINTDNACEHERCGTGYTNKKLTVRSNGGGGPFIFFSSFVDSETMRVSEIFLVTGVVFTKSA